MGSDASGRSCHVSPRSVLRKSRVPATRAQTTEPDEALSCAKLGNVIRVEDVLAGAVGVAAGAAVGAGVRLAGATVAVGDVDATGGATQAVSRTEMPNRSRIIYRVSHLK